MGGTHGNKMISPQEGIVRDNFLLAQLRVPQEAKKGLIRK
jgi:hypothetical protein